MRRKSTRKEPIYFIFFGGGDIFFIFLREPKRTALGPRCVGNWAPVFNGCHRYRRWFCLIELANISWFGLSKIPLLFCLIDVKFLIRSYFQILFFTPPFPSLEVDRAIKNNQITPVYLHTNVVCLRQVA